MSTSSAHDRFQGLLRSAVESKEMGNAALRAGDMKKASFFYKRVYLYLGEYLPPAMVAKTQISGSSHAASGAADENAGLVALLGGQRTSVASFSALTLKEQCALVELYGTTQNNLALASLRLGRFREGVACATCVLDQLISFLPDSQAAAAGEDVDRVRALFDHNAKALLRRASCYVGLAEYAQAEADVNQLDAIAAASGQPVDVAVADLRARIEAGRRQAAQKEKKMMQKMFSS